MKKLLLFLAVGITVSSCKKIDLSGYRGGVAGEWEFVSTYVAFGIPMPPLPPGNGRIYRFGNDGSYERRSHDTILFKGTYMLEKRKDCYGDQDGFFINTNDPSFNNGMSVTREDGFLFFSTSNCVSDGATSRYRKL